jgi:hypothetical protein
MQPKMMTNMTIRPLPMQVCQSADAFSLDIGMHAAQLRWAAPCMGTLDQAGLQTPAACILHCTRPTYHMTLESHHTEVKLSICNDAPSPPITNH